MMSRAAFGHEGGKLLAGPAFRASRPLFQPAKQFGKCGS